MTKHYRYMVRAGSQLGHGCCFDATVVDTTKPQMIGGKHYRGSDGQYRFDVVCECLDMDDAEKICKALNAAEQQND